ncbi:MAG: polysaccharide deacetylase family protein [Solirubrobacteraceae bacterium]
MSALSAWVSKAVQAARGSRPPFVLCYHGVGPVNPRDNHGLTLPAELFERHLDVIAAQAYRTVHVSELWDRIASGTDANGLGALTIDDGLAAGTAIIADILRRRNLTATVYVPTGLLGQPHPHLPQARIVDRAELLELARAGLEIGAHSVDHPDLRTLSHTGVLDQLRGSRETLEDLLGRPVTTMAYPFGSFDAHTMAAARQAGYLSACSCSGPGPWRAYALPREPVYPSTTPFRLRLKVAGLYGPGHALARLRNRTRGESPL